MQSIHKIILLRVKTKVLLMAYKIFPNLPLVSYPFCTNLPSSPLPTTFQSHRLPHNFSIISYQIIRHPFSGHLLLVFVPSWNHSPGDAEDCSFTTGSLNQLLRRGLPRPNNLNLHPIHISYSPSLFFSIPLPPFATVCLVFYVTYFIFSFYYILSEQCLAHNRSQINICQMNK